MTDARDATPRAVELPQRALSVREEADVALARKHAIHFRATQEQGRRGLVIVALDRGPGISDAALAMQDGYSTAGSLGLGLPSARRLSDEFELTTELGKGTTITMKKWSR